MKIILFGFIGLIILGTIPIFAEENISNHIGQIKWYGNNVNFGNLVFQIQVTDQDMNNNPEQIEKFNIRVWSDTDPLGIMVSLYETEKDSGVFESPIYFSQDDISSGQRLHAYDGDTATALYEDNTLPSSYSSNKMEILDSITVYYPIKNPLEKENSFIQIEDETFSRQSLQTGETISESGAWISTIIGGFGGLLIIFFIGIVMFKKIRVRKNIKKKK